MGSNNNKEMRQILDMVSDGKISPEEGGDLISALEGQESNETCPYCAEKIKSDLETCPECRSNLNRQVYQQGIQPSSKKSFKTVGGLSKSLIIYMLAVSVIIILFNVPWIGGLVTFQMLLACLGLTAAILMIKGSNAGWILGIVWSAAQIIEIIVNRCPINRQFLQVGAFSLTNGTGLGINAVGIVLVILFIVARKDWSQNETFNYAR